MKLMETMLNKGTIALLIAIAFITCKKEDNWTIGGRGTTPPPDAVPSMATVKDWLVDKNATNETAALFYNLKKVAKTNVLFGHQDATKRGVTNATTQWANEEHLPAVSSEKSDVKEVTGSYPVVYGQDFLHIANFETGNWFNYEAQIAKRLTIEAYNRGGVSTFAWHYQNPVSQGSFYWSESPVIAVSKIIPGGSHHQVYKNSLNTIGDFAKSLIGADGKLVPVIFRPFHEFDGDWFWWGASHCSPAEYKTLFQFTVTCLRDSLNVRNFLYGWSPDKNFTSEAEYLERYPGDAFVDLVGVDNYGDLAPEVSNTVASSKLAIVSNYAKKANKIAALTETGLQNLTQTNWYTQKLLAVLQLNKVEIAYALVWANTKNAFWTPYAGHAAAPDFNLFKNSDYVMFGDEAPNMYQLK